MGGWTQGEDEGSDAAKEIESESRRERSDGVGERRKVPGYRHS